MSRSGPLVVPAVVRAQAASAPGGAAWLAGLPGMLTALEQAWAVEVVGWLHGGTTSVVARARTLDGRPVVVKAAVPGAWFTEQVHALRAADGDGFVRVLAFDAGRHAALLEALGPSLQDSGLPPDGQLPVLARLLRRVWRRPGEGEPARDKAAELAELVLQLWEQLGRPCSEQVVDQAVRCARRRSAAFDPQAAVVLHGDAAAANAARVLTARAGTEDGYVLLDPDRFVGDRTYDLGVALRDWSAQLCAAAEPGRLLDGWCRLVAGLTSTDPAAVRDWSFLERVSTGLYVSSLTDDGSGHDHLRSAQALVDDWRAAPS